MCINASINTHISETLICIPYLCTPVWYVVVFFFFLKTNHFFFPSDVFRPENWLNALYLYVNTRVWHYDNLWQFRRCTLYVSSLFHYNKSTFIPYSCAYTYNVYLCILYSIIYVRVLGRTLDVFIFFPRPVRWTLFNVRPTTRCTGCFTFYSTSAITLILLMSFNRFPVFE